MATCEDENLDLTTYTQVKQFRNRQFAYVWFGNHFVPSVIRNGGNFPNDFFDGIEVHPTSGVGETNWAEYAALVENTPLDRLEDFGLSTIDQHESELLSRWANNTRNFRQWTIVQIEPNVLAPAGPESEDAPDEPGEHEGPYAPDIFGSNIPEEDGVDLPVIPTIYCRFVSDANCEDDRDTTAIGLVLEIPAVFLYCISPTQAEVDACILAHKEQLYNVSRRRVLDDDCFTDEANCGTHKSATDCMVHMDGRNPECMWCEPNQRCYRFNSDAFIRYCGGIDCSTLTMEDCIQHTDRCWWDPAYSDDVGACRYGTRPLASCRSFSLEDCLQHRDRCMWDPAYHDDVGACVTRPDPPPCEMGNTDCAEALVEHCPPQWWLDNNFDKNDYARPMSCLGCAGHHQPMLRSVACTHKDLQQYCSSPEGSCTTEEQINEQRTNNMYCGIYRTKDQCLGDTDKQCCWNSQERLVGDYLCVDSNHHGGKNNDGICTLFKSDGGDW
jgi:hypothetical protein